MPVEAGSWVSVGASASVVVVVVCFRDASVNNGLSLKSLAADLLNVGLDKRVELRCSDWEADQLTLEQVCPGPGPAPVGV